MPTRLSNWVGKEGHLFERVRLVFEGLGYTRSNPDATTEGTATGAYAANIEVQYKANFTADEILQIIDYAKAHTLDQLQRDKEQGWIDREAVFDERS